MKILEFNQFWKVKKKKSNLVEIELEINKIFMEHSFIVMNKR